MIFKALNEIEAHTLLTAYSLACRGILGGGGKIKEEDQQKAPYLISEYPIFGVLVICIMYVM